LRPFEGIDQRQVQLERLAVMELPHGRTHLKFRIISRTGWLQSAL
jgi:hypothetical protein